jgi:hypothetical protein
MSVWGGDCQGRVICFVLGYSGKVPNATGKMRTYLASISIQIIIRCRTYRGEVEAVGFCSHTSMESGKRRGGRGRSKRSLPTCKPQKREKLCVVAGSRFELPISGL